MGVGEIVITDIDPERLKVKLTFVYFSTAKIKFNSTLHNMNNAFSVATDC